MSVTARVLAVLLVLAPTMAVAAQHRVTAPKAAATQRELRDVEHLSAEQLAAQKDAADRAARAAAEALRLAQERVEAAARLRQAESATADVAARIDALAQRRRDAEQRVQDRAKALQPLLPLIERLSLYPAETLLAVPLPPEKALRGVMVLQGLSRQLEVETEALRRDQADADTAAAALRLEAPRLVEAEAAQKREADVLDQAIATAQADRTAAEAQGAEAAAKVAAAAARMESLRGALAAIEAQRHADEARAAKEAARAQRKPTEEALAASPMRGGTLARLGGPHGQLQPPVIGVVVTGWGDKTDSGPATGLSYHAPPGAHVISPCGGRVVFAEPFRSYGLLTIINCGGGYHVVLSGFERLEVKAGQTLVAGEPVGIMPDWQPGSTERRPALYLEVRHDGTPVNPMPYLRVTG